MVLTLCKCLTRSHLRLTSICSWRFHILFTIAMNSLLLEFSVDKKKKQVIDSTGLPYFDTYLSSSAVRQSTSDTQGNGKKEVGEGAQVEERDEEVQDAQ
ncbi:hypothetical protein Bpfe_015002 [Biomphalaria pfeifferi]|uniref:Uncharacterized protein n=1 Tax=Biomphalaria pfeifferi TaxID=112525 RepID=A0AAD8F9P3_BIOPF|nr:hypothetical protein Bpfe_015002 [Biomphalaria pfeifferi]